MRTILLSKVAYEQYDENESGVATEVTTPCEMQVLAIRCYYKRKGGRIGTRITFTDGKGFAVSETFEQVQAAITAATH